MLIAQIARLSRDGPLVQKNELQVRERASREMFYKRIDKVHTRRPLRIVVLDMDSSESPTYGEQEGSAYNGHFGCTCYHPLFVFNRTIAYWVLVAITPFASGASRHR
jgi:hypothetical protein